MASAALLARRGWLAVVVAAALVGVGGVHPRTADAAPKGNSCKRPCDITPPALVVTSPAPGSTVSGTVTVTGTASDNLGVSRVDLAIDGGAFQPAGGTTAWSWPFPTTSYANGSHTITARATDTSGNTTTRAVGVTVGNPGPDTTPPSVTISTPVTGATVGGTVSVTGAAADDTAVARVEVAVDEGAFQVAGGATSWTWSWPTSNVANGSHTVRARSVDTAGNASAVVARSVTVANAGDTSAPSVSLSSPTSGSTVTGAVTVAGSAGDNAGVARVEVAVDGSAWQTASGTTGWSWSWDTRTLSNATHAVSVQAVDTSGNRSPVVTSSVTVANSSPPQSTCSDGSAVQEQSVTPEGVRIVICTSVGGWTTGSVYNLLQPNALDLALIGPRLTVQVQTGPPSSTGAAASCCDAAGNYYGFGAVISLNPGSYSTFTAAPDAIMAHEYGHAWTYYWLYTNPANRGSWAAYNNFRWAKPDGSQVLAESPSLNTSYNWMEYELAADDYRRLFGAPAAQSQLAFMNSAIPDSRQVGGLADFFRNVWR